MILDSQPALDLIYKMIDRYGSKAFVTIFFIGALAWLVSLKLIPGELMAYAGGSVVVVFCVTREIERKHSNNGGSHEVDHADSGVLVDTDINGSR